LKNGVGNGEIDGQMMQINFKNGVENGEIDGQMSMAALFMGSGEKLAILSEGELAIFEVLW
jgi:hypothetical protein